MSKVLVTGMSGTGKSAALRMLGERGHRVVDTDTDQWSHWVTAPDGSPDWIWREDAIGALLSAPADAAAARDRDDRNRRQRTPGAGRPATRRPHGGAARSLR
jgi:hypothetical protein